MRVLTFLAFISSTQSLLLSLPRTVPAHVHAHAATHAPARSGIVRLASDDDPAPPEVIQAEDNATPNRKYRLATAAVGVTVSAATAGAAIATLSGQYEFGDVMLFGSPVVTLVVDVLVGGTSAWAWQQEQKTKRENIARIWEEVKRRRTGGATEGANRLQRRAKKVLVPGGAMPGAAEEPATVTGADSGGLFANARAFLEEANALGKAQAISLNAQLEDAGVLPPVAPRPPAPTTMDVPAPAAEVAPAGAPLDGAVGARTPAKGKAKKGGSKKKK
ncbi:hypothetical protein Ctob_013246 [Chrysochromulina tobinii]|uniref:Uncharacterized protein n=1 Tax=Chrysochromulina tobinii TaxID=1460289 RepID=A0A0M0LRQ5_9EUKA|nr:hypothetical protein Ctob_013246 [Chrysochromulina tobinii]|eukprot:KOO53735.1 hypothetical protein Ctob_013246 [Chrysochromulina sp. CCMP291]